MVSLFLVMFAASFNAVMDNIKDHWYESVSDKFNAQWWDPEISWTDKNTYKFIPTPISDAWHVFKTGMLICLILAVVLYKPMINWYADFAILGGAWIIIFNLFYNRILIRKQ